MRYKENKMKQEKQKRLETQEIRKENHNKTVLQRYCERGFLDLPHSKFSAEDRKKAGEMLAFDFYMGQYQNIQAVQIRCCHIPTTGNEVYENRLFYRDRYLRAMKYVPREFWPSVRRVCVEDKILKSEAGECSTQLQYRNSTYFQKMLLNLGLERLIEFYLQKNKKSS